MDKDSLQEMGSNPEFIEGIYNYCDRWCERCPFTSNCFLFATEKQHFDDSESRDISNKKFWHRMEELFTITFELLHEAAEDLDIDLDQIDSEDAEKNEARKINQAEDHPTARKAKRYISEVNTWFEHSESLFGEKGRELTKLANLDLPKERISQKADDLQNFVEIIRWYQHQILAKLMRALMGQMDDLPIDEDPIQNDHNGSAKVALIGIDRSITAWGGLLKMFSESEDDIFPILVHLERLRIQIEKIFPDARKFQRPGFDD